MYVTVNLGILTTDLLCLLLALAVVVLFMVRHCVELLITISDCRIKRLFNLQLAPIIVI